MVEPPSPHKELAGLADLSQIQQLIIDGNYRAALDDLEQLDNSQNPEALYMRAVCERYLDEPDAALTTLETLKQLTPGNGRAFQEQGHVYRTKGDWQRALTAYARACQFNPALEAAWRGQIEMLLKLDRKPHATNVAEQLKRLQSLPKPLIAVTDLIAQGKLVKAEELCRLFLQKVPHHVEAMRLLADIGTRLGILDDAEFLLESATAFAPDYHQARIDYIQVLRKKQKFEQARTEAKSLLNAMPENPQFKSIYAVECMQCGDFDEAIAVFDEVLEQLPGDPITLTSRGHALKTNGKFEASVDSYQRAIAAYPYHGEAYYSLANLKRYKFSDAELEQMKALDGNPDLSQMDRIHLNFALGKAFEDRQAFDMSFAYYETGNRLKKAESRYDSEKMSEELKSQISVCDAALFASKKNAGCESPDPIFIVGLPRAGSTLLEQILSSHSQVDGTMELPNILSLAHQLRRGEKISNTPEYPDCLKSLSDAQLAEFGKKYIEDTMIHRQGAPFFIDKMPNNFRHIGLIKLILPNAKIIDARREPMACCFSGFKQLFAEGQEFTYSLANIGQYYKDYVQLMDHWDKVLPGFVLRVQHEDVVADLEGQVRRLLDFCGLPFEAACVEYHKTERNVRTPSSEQVRQPIFTDALEQWRHYEPHLQPLKDALGDTLSKEFKEN